jgi:ferredoxin-NADP reductase
MLEGIVHSGREREVHLVLGFRNGQEHPFRETIAGIAAEHPRIRLHVSYSAPAEGDVLYKDYNHCGRVSIARVRQVLPSNNFKFYVCGPGALMETLVPALREWGVPESHVHFEAFGPASVRSAARKAKFANERFDVRFAKTGRTVTWDGSFASLLEFGEAAGVKMPAGCRAGGCGECMLSVREGSVATLKATGVTVPDGHCLTCISVPASELVLDA